MHEEAGSGREYARQRPMHQSWGGNGNENNIFKNKKKASAFRLQRLKQREISEGWGYRLGSTRIMLGQIRSNNQETIKEQPGLDSTYNLVVNSSYRRMISLRITYYKIKISVLQHVYGQFIFVFTKYLLRNL